MPNQNYTAASIVIGNSITNAIQLNQASALGITTGSSLTSTTLTFMVSVDGSNFYSLYDDSSIEVSLTTASVVRAYNLPIAKFYPWNWFKIREGTSASPVNQATINSLFTIATTIL